MGLFHLGRTIRWWFVALAAALAGCGGGGGGEDARVSAVFDPPALSVLQVEGLGEVVAFKAALTWGGDSAIWLGLEERNNLVSDGDADVSGNTVDVSLQISPSLPVGVHTSQVELLACADSACKAQLPGSPMRVPLRVEVVPQIKISQPQAMRRVGRDPAPRQILPISIDDRAGAPVLSVTGRTDAIDIQLSGRDLVVTTRQVPAGTYRATVLLTASGDHRFRTTTDIEYVVEAPPGGEHPMSLDKASMHIQITQGTTARYRFKVTRPTWTDALDPPEVLGDPLVTGLASLGNDEYEFTVDARNVAVAPPRDTGRTDYYTTIRVRAGALGGQATLELRLTVDPPLLFSSLSAGIGDPFRLLADVRTPLSVLRRVVSIATPDAAAVPWSATTDQPWLKLRRAAGITGVDPLEFDIDPSVFDLAGPEQSASLSITAGRAGTLPVVTTVAVTNGIPRIDRVSPPALGAPTARVYLQGRLLYGTGVADSGALVASGARITGVQFVLDGRFVGVVGVVAVDLDGIVPGRPISLTTTSPIRPSSVTLNAPTTWQVPTGFAALPYAAYGAPSWATSQQALVFTGPDAVWRWAATASGWQAPQTRRLDGVIDATWAADESSVTAVAGAEVVAMDALTLAPAQRGSLQESGAPTKTSFAGPMPFGVGGLRYSAEGWALASLQRNEPTFGARYVGTLRGCDPAEGMVASLTPSPCLIDPGAGGVAADVSSLTTPAGLARSANGRAIAISLPGGAIRLYTSLATSPLAYASLAPGRRIVAVDDSGNWSMRDDGYLGLRVSETMMFGTLLGARAPAGLTAAGYGLTGRGEFALVYAYRRADEASGPRARDPVLLVFDLRGGSFVTGGLTPLVAQIPLQEAVGCTDTRAVGEVCEHQAHVMVAAGDRAVFVLGPRGVAAVSLPDLPRTLAAPRRAAGLGWKMPRRVQQ